MTKQTYKVTIDLDSTEACVTPEHIRSLITNYWGVVGVTEDRVQVERTDQGFSAKAEKIMGVSITADKITSSFIPTSGQKVARKNLPGRVGRIVFVHPNGKFNVHFPELADRRESTTYNATPEKFFLVR